MVPPDSDVRGLPSVHERRTSRARIWQWLFGLAGVTIVGVGVTWLAHNMRTAWHNQPPPPANTAPASTQVFEWPSFVPKAPPKPEPVVATPAAPPQAPGAAPTSAASAPPSDKMMLTDGARVGVVSPSNEDAVPAARAAVAPPEADSGGLASALVGTQTARARAHWLGDRDLTLAKGTSFDCILITKLVSTVPGMVTCTVPRNVYSDNGKVVLIERGSSVTGEYRSDLRLGVQRVFVLWDRIKTVNGVVITLNSPATDSLGESGVGGDIDNHWWQRIGAAVLLSLVQDAVSYETNGQTSRGNSNTIVLPNTSQETQTLAGKVLDQTINIPPTLTRDQGGKVMVMVARDLDFSSVYGLRPE